MIFYILNFAFYILFALLAWRRLPWAVLFVIATLPSYLIRFHLGPVPMTVLEGMVIVIFAIWTAQKLRNVKLKIKNAKFCILHFAFCIPIALFILAATIGMFIAPDLRAAAGIWKAYFIEPVLFFIVLRDLLQNNTVILNGAVRSEESHIVKYGTGSFPFARLRVRMTHRSVISALSLTVLLLSLYAIFQRFTGFGIPPPWDSELRVTSIFPYPNALGLFLAPLVPLMLGVALNVKLKIKNVKFCILHFAFYIIAIISSVIAIAFAKSTGALVGLAAGLFTIGILWLRQKTCGRTKSTAVALGMLATLVALLLVLFPQARNELLLRDWSGHVRRAQWSETIEMLKDRPLGGAGLAGYKEALAPYHKATYLEIFEYPHNIVLNFWSEIGLVGLAAFTWLVIVFFKYTLKGLEIRNWKLGISAMGAAAAMLTLLTHGLVDVPYFKNDLSMLFWIIFALGLTNVQKSENIQSPI